MNDSDDVEFEYETIEIASYSFEVTTISHLPIEMLMLNQSKGVEISGQKVWCGSLFVVDYILRNKQLITDHLIIELGAGTGVLGMVCSRIGCENLILTDNDARSITHMKQDCLKNKVQAEIKVLDWFSPDINSLDIAMGPGSLNICILAGDVLYKQVLLEPFFTTVNLLLGIKKGSFMLLCHVPRAGVEHVIVVEAANRLGLNIEEITVTLEEKEHALKYCPEEDVIRAKLYRIQIK
jgi:predicted nicotinamide N-methyase